MNYLHQNCSFFTSTPITTPNTKVPQIHPDFNWTVLIFTKRFSCFLCHHVAPCPPTTLQIETILLSFFIFFLKCLRRCKSGWREEKRRERAHKIINLDNWLEHHKASFMLSCGFVALQRLVWSVEERESHETLEARKLGDLSKLSELAARIKMKYRLVEDHTNLYLSLRTSYPKPSRFEEEKVLKSRRNNCNHFARTSLVLYLMKIILFNMCRNGNVS